MVETGWIHPCLSLKPNQSTLLLHSQHITGGKSPKMWASPVAQWQRIHLQCRRCRRHGLEPFAMKSPWGGHGNPPWYSFLENPMDRGAWGATVYRVAKSQTWLVTEYTHTHTHTQTLKCLSFHKMMMTHHWPCKLSLSVWDPPSRSYK